MDLSLLLQISRLSTVCVSTRVAKTSFSGGGVLWNRGASPQPVPIPPTCSVGEPSAGASEVPSWPYIWGGGVPHLRGLGLRLFVGFLATLHHLRTAKSPGVSRYRLEFDLCVWSLDFQSHGIGRCRGVFMGRRAPVIPWNACDVTSHRRLLEKKRRRRSTSVLSTDTSWDLRAVCKNVVIHSDY